MKNTESIIEKLLASAASERQLGNADAAEVFEARAEMLRKKYGLPLSPCTEPVKVPISHPEKAQPPKVQDPWGNFPGVPPPERPLTPAQLQALRDAAAAVGGRPLTDKEADRALGRKENIQKSEHGTVSDIWL